MLKTIKKRLILFAFKMIHRRLFQAILEEDVMRQRSDGYYYFNNKKITKTQLHAIREGARSLHSSDVLRIVLKDMKYLANKKMFEDSRDEIDMIFGKAMLYNIDLIESKIKNLSNLDLRK